MSHDPVTMTVICNIILIPNLMFQNKRKIKENRNKKEIGND